MMMIQVYRQGDTEIFLPVARHRGLGTTVIIEDSLKRNNHAPCDPANEAHIISKCNFINCEVLLYN
jgi:hypothetical protein